MIGVSMTELARMIALAFVFGAVMGAVYDVFRITRVLIGVSYGGRSADHLYQIEYPLIGKLKKKDNGIKRGFTDIIIGIGDIIFCLLAGSAFSVFIYYTNDGIFRFHAFFASFLGFVVYYKTLGALIISFAEIIAIFLKIIIKILLYAIAFPFRIMYNIFIKLLRKVFGAPFALARLKISAFFTDRKMKELMKNAESGFLKEYLKG